MKNWLPSWRTQVGVISHMAGVLFVSQLFNFRLGLLTAVYSIVSVAYACWLSCSGVQCVCMCFVLTRVTYHYIIRVFSQSSSLFVDFGWQCGLVLIFFMFHVVEQEVQFFLTHWPFCWNSSGRLFMCLLRNNLLCQSLVLFPCSIVFFVQMLVSSALMLMNCKAKMLSIYEHDAFSAQCSICLKWYDISKSWQSWRLSEELLKICSEYLIKISLHCCQSTYPNFVNKVWKSK